MKGILMKYPLVCRQSYRSSLLLAVLLIMCGMAGFVNAEETSAGISPASKADDTAPGLPSDNVAAPKVASTDCDIEINFDELSAPTIFNETTRFTDTYAYLGVHFEGPGGKDGGAAINESGNFEVSGHSSPNFLAFSTIGTLSDGGTPKGPETIRFDEPIVSFEAAFGTKDGGDVTLSAYNAADHLVHSVTSTIGSSMQRLRVMGQRITKVTLTCTANSWVMDDICVIREGGAGILLLMPPYLGSPDFASPALANLGHANVTKITDNKEFEFAIRTGEWGLIIVENYSPLLSDEMYDALYDYHYNNGRIIFSSYELKDHETEAFVKYSLDVSAITSYTAPQPVYVWNPTPLFETPNSVPDLISFIEPFWIDGSRVTVNSGTVVAGYTESEQAGEAAVVLNTTERILLNTFIPGIVNQDNNSNGKNDMVELYENEIYLLSGTGKTALSVSPGSLAFALPPDGEEMQQVVLENTLNVPLEVGWTSGTARVLFVCGDIPGPFLDELRIMEGIGMVDYMDGRYETPGLSTLLQYDVVLVANNYPFLDSAALGNVLADYVDEGGKVIHAAATSLVMFNVAGRFQSGGYMAFNLTSNSDFQDHTLGDYQVGHPIMEGIAALENYFTWDVSLSYGAALVAEWNNGIPLVATKGDSIVGINLYITGPTPAYGGDVAQLFRNAIVWLRGPCPISFDPPAGHLFPGQNVTVDITADATGLPLNYYKTFATTFKGSGGGNAIVETTLVVSSSCLENAAFAQRPTMPAEGDWGASTSSTASPHQCFESFSGLTGPITALRWWGTNAAWQPGWSECDRPEPDPFLITFYADEAGMPGTPVHEVEVPALVTATGLLGNNFFEVKEYEAILPETVSLNAGWVSIRGAGDSPCWFLWVQSPEGDGMSLQASEGGEPRVNFLDLSLCIVTEPSVHHPADLNADFHLVLSEAIAYLAGWQQGTNPIGYAIRAAYLWQSGEYYVYDDGVAPPLCWVLAP